MLPHERAIEIVLEHVHALPSERVPLESASGRVLVNDVVSTRSLPWADNSAMDGFAVCSADLREVREDQPRILRVAMRIYAGGLPERRLQPGETARIMTGALLPEGADAVVMQEEVEERDGTACFREPADVGQNVRKTGEDIRAGERAVSAGAALTASEIALLASLGHTQAHVHRRPRVAILSTGDELVEPGASTGGGKLADSNALALAVRVRQLGADALILGIARDDRAAILERLRAAAGCEVVLSSAGVSVGEKDFVREVLGELGVTLRFDKVAIRPGKPLVFGTAPGQIYFGLPGNPVSSRVTFEVFVRPALRALMGQRQPELRLPALLAQKIKKVEALAFFARVRLRREDDRLLADPMPKQSSGFLTSLVGAEGLALLPRGLAELDAGTPVDVLPL